MKKFIPWWWLLCGALSVLPGQAQERWVLTNVIAMPRIQGGWGQMAVDTRRHRLYVTAPENNSVEVVDLATEQHLQSIGPLALPTGAACFSDIGLLLVAAGDGKEITTYNPETYERVLTIGSWDAPNQLKIDPRTRNVILTYGQGGLAVVNPVQGKVMYEIKFRARPESFVLERLGSRIYVNVPGMNQVAVVDREREALVGVLPLKRHHQNMAIALDEPNRRLFIGCRRPAAMVVYDYKARNIVAEIPLDKEVGDLYFDPKRKRIYASCGEGSIVILQQDGADAYSLVQKLPTRRGASRSLFIPELDVFCLPVLSIKEQPAEVWIFKVQ